MSNPSIGTSNAADKLRVYNKEQRRGPRLYYVLSFFPTQLGPSIWESAMNFELLSNVRAHLRYHCICFGQTIGL